MKQDSIYIGSRKVTFEKKIVEGTLINFDNESYYKISNSDVMRPFFMSIVSDSNHWMFIASNGGLSAGRKDCDSSLFPYYTDDKIIESADITGSKTILHIHAEDKTYIWEPFSDRYTGIYNIRRNLYKNMYGNKVVFEEINDDLSLTFRYQWNSSNEFGFIKKSTLVNTSDSDIQLTILDGIQNIIPFGVSADLQNATSNLVNAYKKNELMAEAGIGIYALSAIIVDKAEPSEALKASIAWSTGIDHAKYLISSLQVDDFRKGKPVSQEHDIKAEKGAYFVCSDMTLSSEKEDTWMIVANVNQSIIAIQEISARIKEEKDLSSLLQDSIERGSKRLLELNAAADGVQLSADRLRNIRHFSNTLFNIMRGGIFDDNYQIEKADFVKYISTANKKVFKKKEALLEHLPELFTHGYLMELANKDEDKNFKRLGFEYMPLKFSRRHGDPSRPWNRFSINTHSEIDGSKILDYEGNWRDIFQNWEALAHSYPGFIDSMIHKFVNATTFDGYNPYRVTKDGFDWEVIEENDPWSYIGYWGDHQIIYLLKFLEFIEDHYPNKLNTYFQQDIFVYANVPYKIKSYADVLRNPKDTIVFDNELHETIIQKKSELGVDGALLRDKNFFIYKVNLIEKLMVTVLAKVSNFIPEGGIWMNTQRPEWNDANNALVGNGISMVTLYYLRRFLSFFEHVVTNMTTEITTVSKELATFFNEVQNTLSNHKQLLSANISDKDRKSIMDGLGMAGSNYRTFVYGNGFTSDKDTITKSELLEFFSISNKYLDHTIAANKRPDNLFHSYNLMTIESDSEVSVTYLPVMLEGQVAVLSSGYVSGEASLELLDAMKSSALFRADQYSYLLYPNKVLPKFHEKNIIPSEKVKASALLQQLINDQNVQIIEKDSLGRYHFNGNFNNANSLEQALAELPYKKYQDLIDKDKSLLLETFEEVFDHKSFTGRSGTFFGYEGLGSIYWHMVSKLLLSVQESCLSAIKNNESDITIGRLLEHYYEINEGIGVHKSPELYGAFPTDPYSHTPGGKGAQQPGMTGQVKEDILSRLGELGLFVGDGQIIFNPCLLRIGEFLIEPKVFSYPDVNSELKEILLEKDSLCFTYCQIPIIYRLSDVDHITVFYNDDSEQKFNSLSLNKETSIKVFNRSGEIDKIVVSLKKQHLN